MSDCDECNEDESIHWIYNNADQRCFEDQYSLYFEDTDEFMCVDRFSTQGRLITFALTEAASWEEKYFETRQQLIDARSRFDKPTCPAPASTVHPVLKCEPDTLAQFQQTVGTLSIIVAFIYALWTITFVTRKRNKLIKRSRFHARNTCNWMRFQIQQLVDTFCYYWNALKSQSRSVVSSVIEPVRRFTYFALRVHEREQVMRTLQTSMSEQQQWLSKTRDELSELRERNHDMRTAKLASDARINEIAEESTELQARYEQAISKLQKETVGLEAALSTVQKELTLLRQQHDGVIEQKTAIREQLHAKKKQWLALMGDDCYLHWDADNIADWMCSGQRRRDTFQHYEVELRRNLRLESISGTHLSQLSMDDLHRLGMKNFEHKTRMLAEIKQLIAKKGTTRDDPLELCDPITYELMCNPVVVTLSGRTYERKTIMKMIKSDEKEPFTKQKILKKHLVPNRIMKDLLDKYKDHKVVVC